MSTRPAMRTPCACNSPAATTVNAKAKQKLIRVLPKTPPMHGSGSKTALFGKPKFCGCRKISKWCVMFAVNPLTSARRSIVIIIRRQRSKAIDALRIAG